MFNLFGSSDPKINVIDKVWMSKEAKWKACASMLQLNPDCIFIAWFQDTRKELTQILGRDDCVLMAEGIDSKLLKDKMVVFAEHYPLPQKEQAFFKMLNLKEIPVISSLDEPMFMHFGGERTIDLMKKLGMNEDEVIGHAMISSSIRNAQQKMEKKVKIEKLAKSANEWFALNVSG